MDVQIYLYLFQWVFLLRIPIHSGFPHNLLLQTSEYPTTSKTSSNFKGTSNTQVPYFFHKDTINYRNIPKVQQQTGDQNGATLENLEKHIKRKGIMENSNSVEKTSYPGNKRGIDSYLRYLPRNLQKYTSHSQQKETQKLGIGSVLDVEASKHLSHLSGLQIIQNFVTYSSDADISVHNKKQNKLRNKWPKTKTDFSEGAIERRTKRRISYPKAHLHKRHVIVTNQKENINFAVLPNENVTRDERVVNMILGIGAGLVVLGMGIVLGIFGCCCKEEKVDNEKNKEEQSAIINTAEDMDKGLPDARVDLSDSFKEDEEPKSIKDKIKAFENEKKRLITPSPDLTPQGKIKKSEAFSALEGKQLFIGGMTKPPKVIVREDDSKSRDEGLGDTTESKTDDLSKSDTHEEVSEIALDNTSTHSSISQPHNPDVVIASDDEDEFADIQRGTVILKSFQRAKPPRNRSPATRSNRKLRKSPGQPRRSDRDSPDTSSGMDSLSPMMSQSLYVESASEKVEDTRDISGSVPENLDKLVEPVNISKSLRNSTGETENQSKSKGGSSQEVDKSDKSKEIPNGARYKKNTDSPLTKPKYRKKEKEKESDSSADNDSKKRISVSELGSMFENKQKGLASAIDNNKNKTEDKLTKTQEQTRSRSDESTTENNVKRLSGIHVPPNVNNIFYLIDPTVKDKCRSTGDVSNANVHNKGKSKDSAHKKDKASKHKYGKDSSKEADMIPKKRERTFSDPQRHSKEVENTAL